MIDPIDELTDFRQDPPATQSDRDRCQNVIGVQIR